ncbi:glutamine amidotransferase [Pseudonocardia dioxanivorans]|jgi:uncharacterized membrane protein
MAGAPVDDPLAEVPPVAMPPHDDRVEMSDGVKADVVQPGHPILGGTPRA